MIISILYYSPISSQLNNTSNTSSPAFDIINDSDESSYRRFSPTTNTLSSFITDPFKRYA